MLAINQVYVCSVCGNIVTLSHVGGGQLVCCGKPMILQEENSVDASTEKHVPIVEKTGNGVKVVVGSVEHPMEESHFIEWIEILVDGELLREYLKPGMKPIATFCTKSADITARAYCNLHGLWKSV